MAFEIKEVTQAKLASVASRVEKHGDDEVRVISLGIEIATSNVILDLLDKSLRPTLFKRVAGRVVDKVAEQADVPGVEEVMPVLQCNAIERVSIERKHEGWTMHFDTDGEGRKPLTFGQCKLDKFSVEPRQGGSVTLRFRVSTPDLDAKRSGALLMNLGEDVWITLIAPTPNDDEPAKPTRGPDATDLFVERHGTVAGAPVFDGPPPQHLTEERQVDKSSSALTKQVLAKAAAKKSKGSK